MKLPLVTVSAAALILGAGPALANDQQVIDAIMADLTRQGFTEAEVYVSRNRLEVDAYGPGIEGDFYYTRAGALIESDIDYDDDDDDDYNDDDDYRDYDDDDDDYDRWDDDEDDRDDDDDYDDDDDWDDDDDDEDDDDDDDDDDEDDDDDD